MMFLNPPWLEVPNFKALALDRTRQWSMRTFSHASLGSSDLRQMPSSAESMSQLEMWTRWQSTTSMPSLFQ